MQLPRGDSRGPTTPERVEYHIALTRSQAYAPAGNSSWECRRVSVAVRVRPKEPIVAKVCTGRLWYHRSGPRHYFGCPNRNHGTDGCTMSTMVSVVKAEAAILDFLDGILLSWPEWVAKSVAEMRRVIQETATRMPAEILADEKRLAQLENQIENWTDSLAEVRSQTVASRLVAAEVETECLRKRIEHARQMLAVTA
jgi:hypothetical protein